MKSCVALTALLSLAACVQIKDARPDSAHAKIDTSSGLLATRAGRVDSTPASTVPRTPPLIGADSATMIRGIGTPAEVQQALRTDTASSLTLVDSAPSAAPTLSDLQVLRHEMQVPVSGISPSMLHDTYDELRDGTRPHEALDILAARGTPVLSAANGRVLKLFNSKAGGLMVYASDSTQRFILMYGHLDAYQPGLAAGQVLHRGQPLGIVGTTGNDPATVPHLHFAIARSSNINEWWKGAPVNPYPLLKP
jgi:murein DD-endopeptidase MepM/ murein hydrolase activator NlpD